MPTTNPVPSQDPSDLLFNAGKLDEVVSGSNATYTDRLGISRRTMAGIDAAADLVLGGLGYAPPVAYAAGIALTLTTQTVEYAGEVYAPKVSVLPFTTSGTFETAKFRLIQGVDSAYLASGGGASLVGYTPAGTGAVATTVQNKLRERVSIKDFGAAGNGTTDDTQAVLNALASGAKKIVVTADTPTPLLKSMITIGFGQVLELECGETWPNEFPPVRFIKDASMTTPALKVLSMGKLIGGGLECKAGNSGDGVWLAGNQAHLKDFAVRGAGNDGVRVGVDGAYINCNSNYLENVKASYNGRHGIYVHDGSTASAASAAADTNLGVMLHCEGSYNGGNGIRLGRAWWWSVISAHTQSNGGYGLWLSGTITAPDTVGECRYANIIGGDFNESNVDGSANIAGYACAVFMASSNQVLNVTGTFSNLFGSGADSRITGAKIGSSGLQATNGTPLLNFDGANGALTYHPDATGTKLGTSSKRWSDVYSNNCDSNTDYSGYYQTYRGAIGTVAAPTVKNILRVVSGSSSASPGDDVAGVQVVNENQDNFNAYLRFYTKSTSGASTSKVEIGGTGILRPLTDNAQSLGTAATRWSVVYAGTGAINTSDARAKQQVRSLTDAEHAVAVRLKSLVRAFKFNDAVEQKGDNARIHFGVIAQDVKSAFEAECLVAEDYAILCYDEWEDQWETHSTTETVVNEDGETVKIEKTSEPVLIRPAGNRYGVRYDELLAFIISAL